MVAREGYRVDSVCTAAEAVWHSNGVTFYSGIIRDITGRKEELMRSPSPLSSPRRGEEFSLPPFILSPKGEEFPLPPSP